jgi:hypothetical protein
MFPSLIATDLTPCSLKNSRISRWIFGLVVTSVATHRLMITLECSAVNTAAAILVVVFVVGTVESHGAHRVLHGFLSP